MRFRYACRPGPLTGRLSKHALRSAVERVRRKPRVRLRCLAPLPCPLGEPCCESRHRLRRSERRGRRGAPSLPGKHGGGDIAPQCPRPRRSGRNESTPLGCQLPHPGGMVENSPAFQRRDSGEQAPSPGGTAERERFSRPSGTYPSGGSNPALKRRAILACPSGTETAPVTTSPNVIEGNESGATGESRHTLRRSARRGRRGAPSLPNER